MSLSPKAQVPAHPVGDFSLSEAVDPISHGGTGQGQVGVLWTKTKPTRISGLSPNEYTLDLPKMEGWTDAQYWARNQAALEEVMERGVPIRDSHVLSTGKRIEARAGSFLDKERKFLESRGWAYNEGSSSWEPPK
jgi:hypothetical protein